MGATCECSVSLSDKDAYLSAACLTMEVPPRMARELSAHASSWVPISTEVRDEQGRKLLLSGTLLSAVTMPEEEGGRGGDSGLEGKWGQYFRSRRLSANDTVSVLFSLHLGKSPKPSKLILSSLTAGINKKASLVGR